MIIDFKIPFFLLNIIGYIYYIFLLKNIICTHDFLIKKQVFRGSKTTIFVLSLYSCPNPILKRLKTSLLSSFTSKVLFRLEFKRKYIYYILINAQINLNDELLFIFYKK